MGDPGIEAERTCDWIVRSSSSFGPRADSKARARLPNPPTAPAVDEMGNAVLRAAGAGRMSNEIACNPSVRSDP